MPPAATATRTSRASGAGAASVVAAGTAPPVVTSLRFRGGMGALFACRDPEVMVEGPRGTSKTTGILWHLLRVACKYAGARILVCRATRTRLTESALVTFEEEVLGPGHLLREGPTRAGRHAYDLPNGSTIVVGGLDEPTRLLSTPWDLIYVNEATEIAEELWEEMGGALRWNRVPWQQRIGDCNPVAPGHWMNQRADPFPRALRPRVPDPARMRERLTRQHYDRVQELNYAPLVGRTKRIVTFHADNPGYWDFGAWDWTETGRQYVQKQLATMSGHRRKRFFEGIWAGAEGTVYPEFDDDQHVIKPFRIPDGTDGEARWPIYVGYDSGYDHPCAVLWFAVAPNERLYVIDEIYGGGIDIPRLDELIHARNAGRTVTRFLADPQDVFSRRQQGPTIADQFRKARYPIHFSPWPRTAQNAQSMVEAVRQRLINGKLKFFSTCANAIREHQSWSYKRTTTGELPAGDDAYEDRDNHTCDVVKGVVAANRGTSRTRSSCWGELCHAWRTSNANAARSRSRGHRLQEPARDR